MKKKLSNKFASNDIPQANEIIRIFEILSSVKRKKIRYINIAHDLAFRNSNFVEKKYLDIYKKDRSIDEHYHRDVAYYKDACDILGLTKKGKGLTELGNKILSLSSYEKRVYLSELVSNLNVYKTYLENKSFEEFRKLVFTHEELKKFNYLELKGLGDVTLKRRMSTLKSWEEFCSIYQNLKLNNNTDIILIEKDNQKLERAVKVHKQLVEMAKLKLTGKGSDCFEDPLVDLIFISDKKYYFEMKSITENNKGNQFKKAIGQLVFYKNFYGDKDVELIVVLEKNFKDTKFMKDDFINVIWRNGNKFETDECTKKKLSWFFDD